jgi:CDP-diacylglycerol--glycerol-3-phosphate 3-phosphatidyltransferase
MTNPYTIPNLLTALRIALIPVIVGLFYLPYNWSDMACGLLFAVVGITDAFDGYLARKLGQVSRLGAFLDPVADKLIVATALVLIVSKDPLHNADAMIIGRRRISRCGVDVRNRPRTRCRCRASPSSRRSCRSSDCR